MDIQTKLETPEGRELADKQQELEELRSQLADAELEYHTLHAQLGAFESQYFQIVGTRLVRIDELQALIAEAKVAHAPQDKRIAGEATQARHQAQSSAKAFENETSSTPRNRFRPTDDCRKLYLQAAKAIHPDLAPSESEKERRHKYMAALNEAYEKGDEERIRQILNEWNSSPEAVCGSGIGADLIRTIRQCAQVRIRLQEIATAKRLLSQGDTHALWLRAIETEDDPTMHLEDIAASLDDEIKALESELQRELSSIKHGV